MLRRYMSTVQDSRLISAVLCEWWSYDARTRVPADRSQNLGRLMIDWEVLKYLVPLIGLEYDQVEIIEKILWSHQHLLSRSLKCSTNLQTKLYKEKLKKYSFCGKRTRQRKMPRDHFTFYILVSSIKLIKSANKQPL